MKYLLILLAVFSFSNTSFAAEKVPFGSEISANIKNYNRATTLLATSGVLTESAITELAEKGITTIINLRTVNEGAQEEGVQVEKAGMKYINIPVSADTITDDKILADITTALDSITSPTLLHCGSGNRVGAILTRYYMSKGVDTAIALEKGRTSGMKPSLEQLINVPTTSKQEN